MKKTLIAISFLHCLGAFAQQNNIKPAILTGVNISSMHSDTIMDETSFLPFLYFKLTKTFDEKTLINGSAGYSLRGGNVMTPFSRYRFQYLDVQASGQYLFSDIFSAEIGIQPSFILDARYLIGTDSLADLNIRKWSSEWSVFTGLNFHFQGNVSFGIRYFLPVKNVNCNQIQVVISIPIGGTIEKAEKKAVTHTAFQHITALKNGVLIIRLKTSEQIIRHLQREGKFQEAEKISKQQNTENQEIINSFRKYFHFCPVYFFYSNNTDQALSGNFTGILLNDSLEEDSSITIQTQNYYFAEFGLLDPNDESISGTGIEALIIKDKNFKQLQRPFPFYVRKNEFLSGSKNISQVISQMNFNLEQFYKSAKSEQRM